MLNLEICQDFIDEENKVSDESTMMLIGMGFSPEQVRKALFETNGVIESAIEWLFENQHKTEQTVSSKKSRIDSSIQFEQNSKYLLHAFVSHKGPSVHCGHYVCHIRQYNETERHKWVIFNDEKVAFSPQPPIGKAYMYFLRRIDE
jgi:ubiquitin carboxyl-terminal hydrolase 5/13